ncbi:MAG TPA: hypothetical protein PKK99_08170 [Bacteroidia bacterium]|nr:hypothetical protein [Bacteroidia bacterium]
MKRLPLLSLKWSTKHQQQSNALENLFRSTVSVWRPLVYLSWMVDVDLQHN